MSSQPAAGMAGRTDPRGDLTVSRTGSPRPLTTGPADLSGGELETVSQGG
jgi:hypothetical protein